MEAYWEETHSCIVRRQSLQIFQLPTAVEDVPLAWCNIRLGLHGIQIWAGMCETLRNWPSSFPDNNWKVSSSPSSSPPPFNGPKKSPAQRTRSNLPCFALMVLTLAKRSRIQPTAGPTVNLHKISRIGTISVCHGWEMLTFWLVRPSFQFTSGSLPPPTWIVYTVFGFAALRGPRQITHINWHLELLLKHLNTTKRSPSFTFCPPAHCTRHPLHVVAYFVIGLYTTEAFYLQDSQAVIFSNLRRHSAWPSLWLRR